MEKKTLGSLISALRRASGMTQKDLAEKLNVSDKAVSRWERDESAPDLTLLPLIADLFNITVDELLRGQRRSVTEASENAEQTEYKKEENNHRQKMLLANSMRRFKSFMFIPIGLEAAGLLVAMICNFGFYRAALGFLFGTTFMVAAVICSFVFTGMALPTNEDEYDSLLINEYKRNVLTYTYKVLFAALVVMIPIVLIGIVWLDSGSSFVGLPIYSFIIMTPIFVLVIGGMMHEIGKFVILPRWMKKYGICETEKEVKIRKGMGRLTKRCIIILVCSLVIPAIALSVLLSLSEFAFTKGTEFESYEEFKSYIETYKPQISYYDQDVIVYEDILEGEEQENDVQGVYQSVYALNENGKEDYSKLLCRYCHRNGEVIRVRWSSENADRLPVRVYTVHHSAQSESIRAAFCATAVAIMLAEVVFSFVLYLKKRSKILKEA